jgi:hypothetical protein
MEIKFTKSVPSKAFPYINEFGIFGINKNTHHLANLDFFEMNQWCDGEDSEERFDKTLEKNSEMK